jgi:hypothetical protein
MTSPGEGIPVMVYLDMATFKVIEAKAKGLEVPMRVLIAEHLRRSAHVEPAPERPQVPPVDIRTHGRRLTESDRALIRDLTAEGMSAVQISGVLKCHPNAVSYWRAKFRQETEKTA